MCEVFHYIKGSFPVPIPQGGNTTETALPPPRGSFLCWFHPNEKCHPVRNARRKPTFVQERVPTGISMQH